MRTLRVRVTVCTLCAVLCVQVRPDDEVVFKKVPLQDAYAKLMGTSPRGEGGAVGQGGRRV
jgi:hypothetical protein